MKYISKTETGFKCLNFGTTATGKTTSIATLLLAGKKVHFLSADNNALAGIKAGIKIWKVPEEQQKLLKICIPARSDAGLSSFLKQVEMIQGKDIETFLKGTDKEKKHLTGFSNIVTGINNFVTLEGENLGTVYDWSIDTVLVVDSLSVVCEEIKLLISGIKSPSRPEFYAMQGYLKTFLSAVSQFKCNVVILAHPEKEVDAISGSVKIYAQTIGVALNESLPSMFSDVLYSTFDGKKYIWSTKHRSAVCSGRNIDIAEELPQDFRLFFDIDRG